MDRLEVPEISPKLFTPASKMSQSAQYGQQGRSPSTSTLAGLLENLRDSDFGVFVFAADDDAIIKGKLLKVPRDDVVYEAGLFSGYLCPERCFIAVPKSVEVHVPTDLAGTGGNEDGAVLTFSNQVMKQVQLAGLFKGASSEELRELVVRFDCRQSWIEDEERRVATKREISAKIENFCKNHSLNKHRLLAQRRTGYYLALGASIRFKPEARDWDLILKIDPRYFPPGFAYFKLAEGIEALKTNNKVTTPQLKELHDWMNGLPDARKHIASRIDDLMK